MMVHFVNDGPDVLVKLDSLILILPGFLKTNPGCLFQEVTIKQSVKNLITSNMYPSQQMAAGHKINVLLHLWI